MEHLPATPAGDGAAAHHVIAPQEADGLRIAFVCVEPGKEAYSYHWHEQDEEAFFILKAIKQCMPVRLSLSRRERAAHMSFQTPPIPKN